MRYEIKDCDLKTLDVDDTSRRVKVALSKIGVKDFDNDIIEKNAFDKTIKERGPKGKNLIWHLTDHWASLKNAVGKFSDLFMEGDYLVGVTDIPATTWGNDVLEFYKSGTINQHSIGFRTVKREVVGEGSDDAYSVLKEIMLYEGSAVLWGANENTPTLSVGKSLTKEEATSEYAKTLEELGKLTKMFKSGHLSDQSYELIEIKISQLSTRLQQLFDEATQPAVKAVEPDVNEVLDVLTTFKKSFKRQDDDGSGKSAKAA